MAALEALPRVPLHRLGAALGEGELGARILPCLHSSSKEVGGFCRLVLCCMCSSCCVPLQ